MKKAPLKKKGDFSMNNFQPHADPAAQLQPVNHFAAPTFETSFPFVADYIDGQLPAGPPFPAPSTQAELREFGNAIVQRLEFHNASLVLQHQNCSLTARENLEAYQALMPELQARHSQFTNAVQRLRHDIQHEGGLATQRFNAQVLNYYQYRLKQKELNTLFHQVESANSSFTSLVERVRGIQELATRVKYSPLMPFQRVSKPLEYPRNFTEILTTFDDFEVRLMEAAKLYKIIRAGGGLLESRDFYTALESHFYDFQVSRDLFFKCMNPDYHDEQDDDYPNPPFYRHLRLKPSKQKQGQAQEKRVHQLESDFVDLLVTAHRWNAFHESFSVHSSALPSAFHILRPDALSGDVAARLTIPAQDSWTLEATVTATCPSSSLWGTMKQLFQKQMLLLSFISLSILLTKKEK